MTDGSHKHQKVHDFLKRNPIGVLSTVSEDGTPWGAAIYYVADEDFKFYFVTRAETSKYKNLEKNPHASLTVVDPGIQTTVQAAGLAAKMPVQEYMDVVFNKLAKIKPEDASGWTPPIEKLKSGDYMPLCLTPSKLHYADYQSDKSGTGASYIERIIG